MKMKKFNKFIGSLLLATTLAFGQIKDYKAELEKLTFSLKNEGYEISEYLNDSRFKIYEVKPLNKKTNQLDYTNPMQSKYLWPASIQKSKNFMKKYENWLLKAEEKYGIKKEDLVALLKMESDLGDNIGNYRVFNSLVSQYLQTSDEKRKSFFYEELKAFINLNKKLRNDLMEYKGSFAGAVGPMQFMPSNLIKYGIDFDEDGRFDPYDMEDAIGSAANFLARHGYNENPLKALKAYNNHPTFGKAILIHAEKLKNQNDKK
ncbi:MAG: lytic murein transglycosylase [Candidatus Aenigmatarchaeota archaeon]